MSEIYEVCRYRLRPGTTPEALREDVRTSDAWLARQQGFLAREVISDPSGTCVELLRWRSQAEAEAAMAASASAPEVLAASAIIDFDTFVSMHGHPLAMPAPA